MQKTVNSEGQIFPVNIQKYVNFGRLKSFLASIEIDMVELHDSKVHFAWPS